MYARGRLSGLETLLQDIKNLHKEDNDDIDDFGNFEEPEAFSEAKSNENFEASFASSSGWASLDSSPRGQIDQILIGVN